MKGWQLRMQGWQLRIKEWSTVPKGYSSVLKSHLAGLQIGCSGQKNTLNKEKKHISEKMESSTARLLLAPTGHHQSLCTKKLPVIPPRAKEKKLPQTKGPPEVVLYIYIQKSI
jgi:hypothetical protein